MATNTPAHCLLCEKGRYSSAKGLDDDCISCIPGKVCLVVKKRKPKSKDDIETHLTQLYENHMYILNLEIHLTLLVASRLEKFGNAIEEGAASESEACAECGIGKFSNKPGQISCTSCDPGTVTNETGQTFCSSCNAGESSFHVNTMVGYSTEILESLNRTIFLLNV